MKLVDDCIYEVYGKVRLGLREPIMIISFDKLMMTDHEGFSTYVKIWFGHNAGI